MQETAFFRDRQGIPQPWRAWCCRELMTEARKPERLRLWSRRLRFRGRKPYSLAMLTTELARQRCSPVEILATDLSTAALEKAQGRASTPISRSSAAYRSAASWTNFEEAWRTPGVLVRRFDSRRALEAD